MNTNTSNTNGRTNQVPNIDFIRFKTFTVVLSALLLAVSLFAITSKGFQFGIDFTGGTIVELTYPQAVEPENLRNILTTAGLDAQVQHFGAATDVLIRVANDGVDSQNQAVLSNQILTLLSQHNAAGQPQMQRIEFVGPQVGEELTQDGALAVLYALIGILIYVAVRFEYRFSFGAVLALIHDVVIVLGVFALFDLPFDLTVLAALLAVIGYSLNDTIVVFDRVRENFRTIRKGEPVDVVNAAINQMLSRTIMTSVTTLLVLVALFFLGGEIIRYFALALILGVVVGTYSSIYVASLLTLFLGISRDDLMVPEKDDSARAQMEADMTASFKAKEQKREQINAN